MAKVAPGMILYRTECSGIFEDDVYTDAEIGQMVKSAWACFVGISTKDECAFSDRGMQMAFNAIMRSVEQGASGYKKRVEKGGLGGAISVLLRTGKYDMIQINAMVDDFRAKDYDDLAIASCFRKMAKEAKEEIKKAEAEKRRLESVSLIANRTNYYNP